MTDTDEVPGVCDAFAWGFETPSQRLTRRLAKIAQREPQVRAFVTRIPDEQALILAEQSDRRWRDGAPLSPLDGATVAVKDIIETRDMPTGQGSPLWSGTHTGRDAATVAALRAAGAIILGKTTTTEFAATHVYHETTNPHDEKRTPGGSSAGSAAAVAAGMSDFAIGSQVVGSTIRPASYCGCHGYKPTVGALNRGGSYDTLSQSCVGLFASGLEDLWHAAQAIASRVGGDPGARALNGSAEPPVARRPVELAILRGPGWPRASAGARAGFQALLERLHAAGVACIGAEDAPELQAVEDALSDAFDLTIRICAFESLWPLAAYEAAAPRKLSDAMQRRLATARTISSDTYVADIARREAIRVRYHELAQRFDGVITLSASTAAPVDRAWTGDPSFAIPASLLGCPALSLPILVDEGLPLGAQIMGWADRDMDMFSIARGLCRTASLREPDF